MGASPRELADHLRTRAEARVGRTVAGKWQLQRLLGVGGVAAVYAARHRNSRVAAIKILHSELAVDASIRRRFLREGYVANQTQHPGAVSVLDDAVDDDGSVFLVMELLQGESLEERIRRVGGRLSVLDALQIVHELLAILESAHAHDILHRDVTPGNVFITESGQVKLLDFGIARLREADAERTMSSPGTLGTPAFMPPEQARGLWEQLDASSDLWAVGAVLFRALAGRNLHSGRTPAEVLLSAMTQSGPTLSSVVSDVDLGLAAIVDRALSYEKADRWASAGELRATIAEAYERLSAVPISQAEPLRVPSRFSSELPEVSETHTGFETTVAKLGAQRSLRRAAAGSVLLISIALMTLAVRGTRGPSNAERVVVTAPASAAPSPGTSPTSGKTVPASAQRETSSVKRAPVKPAIATSIRQRHRAPAPHSAGQAKPPAAAPSESSQSAAKGRIDWNSPSADDQN